MEERALELYDVSLLRRKHISRHSKRTRQAYGAARNLLLSSCALRPTNIV